MEISRGDIINVGTGIPNDTVGGILAEEEVAEEVTPDSGIGYVRRFAAGRSGFWNCEKLLCNVEA